MPWGTFFTIIAQIFIGAGVLFVLSAMFMAAVIGIRRNKE